MFLQKEEKVVLIQLNEIFHDFSAAVNKGWS